MRFDGESYITKASVDPLLTKEMCVLNGERYVGNNPPETPLLYPTGMDLSGLPPMCIHVGEREILLSDSLRLAVPAKPNYSHSCAWLIHRSPLMMFLIETDSTDASA